MLKKNARDSEEDFVRVIKPRRIPVKLAAYLSLYTPSVWSRAVSGFDFVHHDSPYFLQLARYVPKSTGTVHDLFHLSELAPGEVSRGLRSYLIRTFRYLSKLRGIAVVSHTTDRRLKAIYPSLRTTVIHPWNRPEFHPRDKLDVRTRLQLPHDRTIVLSVGSDMRRKNLDLLPDLVKALPSEYLLVRVGPSRTIADRLGRDRFVSIRDVPEESYPLYFNAADVLIMPSLDEGFGSPIIQAVGSGLPVVASDIEVFREVLGAEYPYFAPPHDLARWREHVAEVCGKYAHRKGDITEFRSLSQHYSFARGHQEFAHFLRDTGVMG